MITLYFTEDGNSKELKAEHFFKRNNARNKTESSLGRHGYLHLVFHIRGKGLFEIP